MSGRPIKLTLRRQGVEGREPSPGDRMPLSGGCQGAGGSVFQ